jgi:hypothetical protein
MRVPLAPPQKMKSAVLLFLFVSAAPWAAAGGDSDPGAYPQTDIRREILSVYRYEAPAKDPGPATPFLTPKAIQAASQEILAPAPTTLRDARRLNNLRAAVVQQEADARSAAIASRLGIGVRSVQVGRHLVAGAATVFYVPVAVGIGVIW